MKKKVIILIGLLAVLSFNACSKAASGVKETPTIVEPVIISSGDTTYFYSTTGAGIGVTWSEWGTGTVQKAITTDTTYDNSIKLTSTGGWGNCIAFADFAKGLFSDYETLNFKIKSSDYTEIFVKLPEEEKLYQLSSGTALADGWVQMSIPLSDFSNAVRTGAVQFAIFNKTQDATGKIMYLTDINLTGTVTNPIEPDPIADTTGPTVVAPSTLPATASVLYSSDATTASSYATITDYVQGWYGAIGYSQVDVAGENVLRYTSSGLGGECVGIVSNSFDVSSKTRFHMDIYLAGVDFFQMKFVDATGGAKLLNLKTTGEYNGTLIAEGQWVTIDVALDDMPVAGGAVAINWSTLSQTGILLTAAAAGDRAYIDNMYFY